MDRAPSRSARPSRDVYKRQVVGAWIKNPAFGDKVTETVTDEASGTTATVVTGHTGFYTMKTDADGAFAFNDDNTAGLLPYVQMCIRDREDADAPSRAAGASRAAARTRKPRKKSVEAEPPVQTGEGTSGRDVYKRQS